MYFPIKQFCFILIFTSCLSFSQQSVGLKSDKQSKNFLPRTGAGKIVRINSSKGELSDRLTSSPGRSTVIAVTGGTGILDSVVLQAPDDVRLIVQFKTLPLSSLGSMRLQKNRSQIRQIQSALNVIRSEHAQFQTDVKNLDGVFTSQGKAASTQFHLHFTNALNGVAISTKRWIGEEIQKLPYVLRVSEDLKVKAFDDASNVVIGAPSVWDSDSVHGEGVDIGIIDTGIDYLHEALGGAPFPNSKVVGGYDFVNDDPDPMDDNGHGSHVAGIAAGDGPPPMNLRGVAYKARLWAFKVLDPTGTGYFSWIIAGIDRAMDPDGDPSTPTPIGVINMSLGSNPYDANSNPSDPLSQAVDNANRAGIVCAIAAGNAGPDYETMSSPGCARGALTVGATNDGDTIAPFSSRGPSHVAYSLKPDVVAPGVNITSVKLGGGYIAYSGTSMATPHVAGAAALLRQLHPDWTPEEVKASLMESAKDIGQDVLTEGAGRISVSKAAQQKIVVTPGVLNFGIDDVNPPDSWITTQTLVFHNDGNGLETFNLSSLASYTGVSIQFNPSSITVAGESTDSVAVTLTVDQSAIYSDTRNYISRIMVQSINSPDTFLIPFGFVKTPMIRLIFDEDPFWFGFYQPKTAVNIFYLWQSYWPTQNDTINFVDSYFSQSFEPSQPLDMLGGYFDMQTKIVKEDLQIEPILTLRSNKADAKNKISIRCLDRDGQTITTGWQGAADQIYRTGPLGALGIGVYCNDAIGGCPLPDGPQDYYFPDITSDYSVYLKYRAIKGDGTVYEFPFVLEDGIDSSKTVQNDPAAFKKIRFDYAAPDTVSTLYADLVMEYANDHTDAPYSMVLSSPFTMTGYYAPNTSHNYPNASHRFPAFSGQYVYTNPDLIPNDVLMKSGKISVFSPDSVQVFQWSNPYAPALSSTADSITIRMGYGSPRYTGICSNSSRSLQVWPEPVNTSDPEYQIGGVYPLFEGSVWDIGLRTFHYHFYSGTRLVDSGYLSGGLFNRAVPGGQYTLKTDFHNYKINNVWGTAIANVQFDTRNADQNSPYINDMRILSNGLPTDQFSFGADNEIQFDLGDNVAIDSASVYFRPFNTSGWVRGSLIRNGNQFVTQYSADSADMYTSMELRVFDPSGNSLTYTLEPAFHFKAFPPPHPQLSMPANGAKSQPSDLQLQWGDIYAAAGYRVQVARDSLFGVMVLDDSAIVETTRTITGLQHDTWYYWRVSAHNPAGPGPFSDVRKFKTILKTPDSFGATGSSLSLNVSWSSVPGGQSFRFQLANDPTFSSFMLDDSTITDTMKTLNALPGHMRYFWRVRASNGDGYSEWSYGPNFNVLDSQLIRSYFYDLQWNIISVPLAVDDPSKNFLFGDTNSSAFGYQGDYTIADNLLPGLGYWLRWPAKGIISITGKSITSDTVEVKEGWNLVGSISTSIPIRTIVSDPPGMVTSLFFGYENGYVHSDSILPGKGYWVKVNQDGNLIFTTNVSGASLEKRMIRILSTSEMPPPPPDGAMTRSRINLPKVYALEQSFPNPFNPSTTIQYQLPSDSRVVLKVYNLLGQVVATLVSQTESAGYKSVNWNAPSFASGIYFYRLYATGVSASGGEATSVSNPSKSFTQVRKMILMK